MIVPRRSLPRWALFRAGSVGLRGHQVKTPNATRGRPPRVEEPANKQRSTTIQAQLANRSFYHLDSLKVNEVDSKGLHELRRRIDSLPKLVQVFLASWNVTRVNEKPTLQFSQA